MARVFTKAFAVPADAIDANGHVNNIAYVEWMQEIAIEHSTSVGWPMARYIETGATWVARSHFVEYLRPAFEGEAISVHTWVAGMAERSCQRRYLFVRDADRKPLARAETVWVCVEAASGRPIRIPETMRASFPLAESDDAVAAELGLERL